MPKPGYETRSGAAHPRWSDEKKIGSNGYAKIRVGCGHPLADPNGYAYEHLVVWVSAGKQRPPSGYVIHHKNEVKTDNRIENLEMMQRVKHGVHHAAKLSDAQVVAIREMYDRGEADTTEIARQLQMPQQSIWKIIRGITRQSAGGPIQSGSLRGKRATGRLLDGVEHNAFPEARA